MSSRPRDSGDSLPARLRALARRWPERVALREKRLGLWQETTWAAYRQGVATAGMALRALGVGAGDRVAIHSENRVAWVWTDLGAQGIHAASVGLYPTNPAAEVEYLLGHSGARVLIAEDQEQVDKALTVADRLPALEHIVYLEPRGLRGYDDRRLLSWEAFLELGRRALAAEPEHFDQLVDAIDPESAATILYTSGTTGPPKGALLSHRNLAWTRQRMPATFGFTSVPARVELLSYLPLCHIFEKIFTFFIAFELAATVNFAESIDTVVADLVEIQPTYFPAPPRIWEKMAAGVRVRIADASILKRGCFALFLKAGSRNVDRILERGRRGWVGELIHAAGWLFVYRALKQKLGLRACAGAISAAAPIAPEVLRFFMALGVPVYEAYGMTENAGYATCNRPGAIRLGTVGRPNPDAEVRLADDGEILVRNAAVFAGYFRDPEASAEAVDEDGWLHTGDVGVWEDGYPGMGGGVPPCPKGGSRGDQRYLRIVDRKKDVIITAGGKNVSPSEIENKLKFSPYVKEAVVIGDRRRFVSALIGIELETVGHWARGRNLAFTTYRDLSEKPATRQLIQAEVDRVNRDFSRAEQIRSFRLLPKELDHDDGELTATQKVKRRRIEEEFRDLIEEIYA